MLYRSHVCFASSLVLENYIINSKKNLLKDFPHFIVSHYINLKDVQFRENLTILEITVHEIV